MSVAQPGIQGSITKVMWTDSACVEEEDSHGEHISSTSPRSAGQAARARGEGAGEV